MPTVSSARLSWTTAEMITSASIREKPLFEAKQATWGARLGEIFRHRSDSVAPSDIWTVLSNAQCLTLRLIGDLISCRRCKTNRAGIDGYQLWARSALATETTERKFVEYGLACVGRAH